ncbi:MAG: HDOD domain-containing protein [Gammaproteobacteria bacterium]|jgi:HD-like signal output (HDOD) protein|nr:HDOD domain-containing protein [Gammaproteobacteria bacterium]
MGIDAGENKTSITPEMLVEGTMGLVSLPEISIKINEMVDDPKCSAVHIGKVIGKDAALTARLLKIVNSAFYRFPSRVETVSRAITIIGYRELRDLVFAATVSGMFERISTDIIDLDSFWRHGIYSGILSRLIADNCQVLHGERLFVAGLMHDIGQLIISYKLPKLMRAIMDLSDKEGIALYEAEAQILGFTHAEVGAELMKAWSFPETQQNVARYHHNPSAAKDSILEVNIVYLANIIAQIAETGLVDTDRLGKIDNKVWVMTKVSKSDVESLLVEAREQFIEALTLFRPKGRLGASNAA